MEVDLLRGVHFRLPHPDHQINFQRAVASTREFAHLLRGNVLAQLVFRTEEQLAEAGVSVRINQKVIDGTPATFRNYLAGHLFVQLGYTENKPHEALFIRKTDPVKGWRVEIGMTRGDEGVGVNRNHIGILWAANGAPRIIEKFKLSASPTELWCEVATTCGHGTYTRTDTPKSEYPAIENTASKIRCVTQQVAEILA